MHADLNYHEKGKQNNVGSHLFSRKIREQRFMK